MIRFDHDTGDRRRHDYGEEGIWQARTLEFESRLGSPSARCECLGRSATPKADEIRRLLHALREPVGAFAINVALLDDEALNEAARQRMNAMLSNVERMAKALAAITKAFGLDVGDSTPLSLINGNGRPLMPPIR